MKRDEIVNRNYILRSQIQRKYAQIEQSHFKTCGNDVHNTCKIPFNDYDEIILLEKEYVANVLAMIDLDYEANLIGEATFPQSYIDLSKETKERCLKHLDSLRELECRTLK